MGGWWQGAVPQWQQLAQDTLGLLAGDGGAAAPPPSKSSLTGMSGLPLLRVIPALLRPALQLEALSLGPPSPRRRGQQVKVIREQGPRQVAAPPLQAPLSSNSQMFQSAVTVELCFLGGYISPRHTGSWEEGDRE